MCVYYLLCRIQFPDPHARYRSNQVVVNGTVDAVLQARNELLVGIKLPLYRLGLAAPLDADADASLQAT